MGEMRGNWKGSLAQGAEVEGPDGLVMMLWTWPCHGPGNLGTSSSSVCDSWVEKCRAVAVNTGDSSGEWFCSEGEAVSLGKGHMALGLGSPCGHSPPLCLKVSPWSGEGKGLLPGSPKACTLSSCSPGQLLPLPTFSGPTPRPA